MVIADDLSPDERILPGLYMLWPPRDPPKIALAEGYTLRPSTEEDHDVCTLLLVDGESMSQPEWQNYKDKILPDGLFVIVHDQSNELVATAGAVHNPNPGRYYFPFGGELGYLIVHPEHRGKGLGKAICSSVVQRFLAAGYESVRVAVKGWRLPAIKTYLKVGFVPFLHDPSVLLRWKRICEKLERPYTPNEWPTDLRRRVQ